MNGWKGPRKERLEYNGHNEMPQLRNGAEVTVAGYITSSQLPAHESALVIINLLDLCENGISQDVGGILTASILLGKNESPETCAWFEMRGARKLLKCNACVEARGKMQVDNDGKVVVRAKSLKVTECIPENTYIAKCITLSHLNRGGALFCGNVNCSRNDVEISLASAMDISEQTLKDLRAALERNPKIFFKCKQLHEVCKEMRDKSGWSKAHYKNRPPSKLAVKALLRMEERWPAPSTTVGAGDTVWEDVNLPTNADPSLNLPNQLDKERKNYIEKKKVPQIKTMIALVEQLAAGSCSITDSSKSVTRIVDVGGGRGDLAIALASSFGKGVFVTVLDINAQSLEAGKKRVHSIGLKNIEFQECAIEDAKDLGDVDLVVGLHCCGGLADAAATLAVHHHASFAICTCCFRSNHHLARLIDMAVEELSVSDYPGNALEDMQTVCLLAQRENFVGQFRAQTVVNRSRLHSCQKLFNRHNKGNLFTTLAKLPEGCSSQCSIMVGRLDIKRNEEKCILADE